MFTAVVRIKTLYLEYLKDLEYRLHWLLFIGIETSVCSLVI